MKNDDPQLAGLRARAQVIPIPEAGRREWERQFNLIPAVRHFETKLDLEDPALVRVVLEKIEEHHLGGLRLRAVNGAVMAGLFDCALGVAGVIQLVGKRAGTCELSMKFVRAAFDAPLEAYAACVKRTDNLAFVESELYSDGKLCALATGLVAVATNKGTDEAFW